MPPLLQLQKLPGKGDRRWKKRKRLCVFLWLTRRSRVRGRKCVLEHPIARATSWQRKIRKFTVTAFRCEESTHRKEKQPRDLSDARQRSTPPEPPDREGITPTVLCDDCYCLLSVRQCYCTLCSRMMYLWSSL